MEGCRAIVLHNGVQQDLSRFGDAAADHDDIRIHHGSDVGEGAAQHFAQGVDQLQGHGIARLGRIKDILAGDLRQAPQGGGLCRIRQGKLCQAHNAGRGRILLQASLFAAAADSRLIFTHLHVADLARCAMAAGQDPAADDDAAADTGPQRHHDDVFKALSAAAPLLAQRRHIGVIAGDDPDAAQESRQLLRDIEDTPAQVDAAVDHAVIQHGARNTDADAFYIVHTDAVLFQPLPDRIRNVREDQVTAIVLSGRDLPLLHKGPVIFEKAALDGRASDVDTECILLHAPLSFPAYDHSIYCVPFSCVSFPVFRYLRSKPLLSGPPVRRILSHL